MELTSRISLTYAKTKHCYCLPFLLRTVVMSFICYLLQIYWGCLARTSRAKNSLFSLKSLTLCISEAWLQSCMQTPSHFSLSGDVHVPDSVCDSTVNAFHTPSAYTAAMHQGIWNRDNIIKGYYQQTTH